MSIKIERIHPRGGIAEHPLHEANGFKLAGPVEKGEKHHAKHATYVQTLEEAADLIEKQNFSIWMVRPGKRASLICPTSLKMIRC
jgi:hypothetical protein